MKKLKRLRYKKALSRKSRKRAYRTGAVAWASAIGGALAGFMVAGDWRSITTAALAGGGVGLLYRSYQLQDATYFAGATAVFAVAGVLRWYRPAMYTQDEVDRLLAAQTEVLT